MNIERIRNQLAKDEYAKLTSDDHMKSKGGFFDELDNFNKNKMSADEKNEFRFVL